MGRATIASGGEDGRYVLSLDYGDSLKTRLLAALSLALAEVETRISEQQVRVDEAQAKEDIQAEAYRAEVEQFIAEHPGFAPGSPKPDDRAVIFELSKLREKQTATRILRDRVNAFKFDRAQVLKRIAYWNAFVPTEQRAAWCVDLTEDAEVGATVATIEIPGESGLILIAPGARAPTNADGMLMAREVMSPEQAFWNAAVLPGWQKHLPTYRWGTITSIDNVADTCSLTLAAATSSARALNVNQETVLADVPIVYMVCNAGPFEVGSRVVVHFEGQDWDSPTVIGFLDNPRPCNWTCIGNLAGFVFYAALVPGTMTAFDSEDLDVRCRVNGGEWFTMLHYSPAYDAGVSRTFQQTIVPEEQPDNLTGLKVNFVEEDGAPYGYIAAYVIPYQPFGEDVNVAEFVIRISGDIVFNVAQTDTGAAGYPNYRTGQARTRGGINRADGYFPMTRLEYLLFSEE